MNNNKNSMKVRPVISYSDIEMNKDNIYKENKKRSGIYRWINKINNKSYIGSAVNLSKRLTTYFSLNALKRVVNKESSMIYSAIIKYGYSKFTLEILEYCDRDHIINREQYYIDLLSPEYNILRIAGSRFGHKLTFEAKKAISIASRSREYLSKAKLESKLKVEDNSVFKVIKSRTKLKLSLRSQGVSVKVFDSSGNFINKFPNIKSAAVYLGLTYTTISRVFDRGSSYDDYIYKFELKDLRIWIYDNNNKLIQNLNNAKTTSVLYNIPRSTLSAYIKSGKLYKKKFYFYSADSINNPYFNNKY